jgi:hypothetical protein
MINHVKCFTNSATSTKRMIPQSPPAVNLNRECIGLEPKSGGIIHRNEQIVVGDHDSGEYVAWSAENLYEAVSWLGLQ